MTLELVVVSFTRGCPLVYETPASLWAFSTCDLLCVIGPTAL